MRLRQIFVIGLALSLLGVGVPAWSEDDPRSCNDLMSEDAPAYVVCHWMATPDEVDDIANFWLGNDGQNMKDTGPMDDNVVDCTTSGERVRRLRRRGRRRDARRRRARPRRRRR